MIIGQTADFITYTIRQLHEPQCLNNDFWTSSDVDKRVGWGL